MGERRLSTLSAVVVEIGLFSILSSSEAGVGGNAPGMASGVVGCDVSGPAPCLGCWVKFSVECCGDAGGAGMFVPAVREKSTGLMERM